METIKQKNKMKFVIYARKSSEGEERQAKSIGDQISIMKEIAEKNQIEVIDIFQESKSAKEPGRPVFNSMIEKINDHNADGILCWKLDRLARNPVDAGTIQWLLQKGIIKKIKAYDREYIPEDNVVMACLEFGMANQYIRDLSNNVKRGLIEKAKRGEYPSRSPVGYLTDHKTRQIILDGDKWKYVEETFRLYATGLYSIETIANQMNEEGFRTVGEKKFFPSGIHRMLTNPIYHGWFHWKGQLYKGVHPAIISKNIFDKVQEVLFSKTHDKRNNICEFTFRGFLTCGECGLKITAETKKGHNYYRCTKSKGTENCSQKYIREEVLIEEIKRNLSRYKVDNELLDIAIQSAKENGKGNLKRYLEVEKQNKNLLNRNLILQNSLVEKFIENKIPDEIYNRKLAELRNEEASLEGKLNSAKANYRDVFHMIEQSAKFAKIAHTIFENGDNEEKKSVVSIISSNITIKDKKIEKFELAKPFPWLFQDLHNMKTPKGGKRAFELFDKAKKTLNKTKKEAFATINKSYTYLLGKRDSNPRSRDQNPLPYRLAIPQRTFKEYFKFKIKSNLDSQKQSAKIGLAL